MSRCAAKTPPSGGGGGPGGSMSSVTLPRPRWPCQNQLGDVTGWLSRSRAAMTRSRRSARGALAGAAASAALAAPADGERMFGLIEGSSSFHRCTHCRKSNRPATQRNRPRPNSDCPVVSVAAFLKLADWYRSFVGATQGEPSCKDRNKGADKGVDFLGIVSEPALAGSAGRGSSASTSDVEPDHSQAASAASQRKGGEA